MQNPSRLTLIKSIHTGIWLFQNVVLFYMAYEVITNQIDYFIWFGIGCIVLEWIVLLIYKWQCPLTIVARRYSDSKKENFDIYLPNWLAKYNKEIYISFFVAIVLGLIFRMLNR